MADFGAPVAQNVDPSAGLNTLSNILGMKSKQLTIQGQQQGLEGQAADVQAKQQTMQERQAVSQMFRSGVDDQGNPIRNANGDPDFSKLLPALTRMAPLTGQDYAQSLIKSQTDKVGLQAASTSLDAAQRKLLMGPVQAAAIDPSAKSADVNAGIDNLVKAHPEMENAAGYLKSLTTHLDSVQDPAQRTQFVNRIAAHMQVGQEVGTQPQAASVDAGGQVQTGTTSPPVSGGAFTPAASLTKTIPPGWTQYEDPLTHAQYIRNLQTGESRPMGSTYSNGNTPPPAPSGSAAPPQYKAGDAGTIAANTQSGGERYNGLVNAASESPARINVLDNIIRLAPQIRTGPGSGFKAGAETALGQIPGFKGAADDASAYNEATKFLHQNALRSWQAAGGTGTNAQLATVEGANPNPNVQDPKTIVDLAKYAKAGELALQAKATAHQSWMHQPGNNFANQSDFESQWRQNFDPTLFQLKTWSPQEATKHLQGLSQPQIDDLAKKQAWLKSEGVY